MDGISKDTQALSLGDSKDQQPAKKPNRFTFNVGASEFVPSWGMPAAEEKVVFQPAATTSSPSAAATGSVRPPATIPIAAGTAAVAPPQSSRVTGTPAKEPTVSSKPPVTPEPSSAPNSKPSTPPAQKDKAKESSSTAPKKEAPVSVEELYDPSTDSSKEHLNIVFMGHVDAGKSTMGGHILLLTGMVDKRTMEKYEKEAKELGRESWYLSWALDLNSEERAKGKTTEYGRAYFETEKRRYTILDAPGHKTFVPSMIGGASQADVGVLVISARKGEFETGFERGGQTREHAMLAKTAGVKKLIMVINKMDDPTVQWSKERYDEIVSKIAPFLKGVGYGKNDLEILPISGFSGANLKDRVTSDVCPWHEGPSLLELLDNMEISDRNYNAPFMMPIADKFKDMGTVVIGKIESGKVKKGQSVLIMPNRKLAEVMAIMQEDEEVNMAKCGDNIRIRLKNAEEEDAMAGFVLCGTQTPVKAVTSFEAQLAIVEYKSIMCAGYTAVMHAHAAVEEVTLSALLHMIDKKSGKKSKHPPKFLKQGDSAIVRLETAQPICLETYGEYQQLGRFTLRDEGKTVAVGKVTKLYVSDE